MWVSPWQCCVTQPWVNPGTFVPSPKPNEAWPIPMVNMCLSKTGYKKISLQQVVLQSSPVIVTMPELLCCCIWEELNLYIFIGLLSIVPLSSVQKWILPNEHPSRYLLLWNYRLGGKGSTAGALKQNNSARNQSPELLKPGGSKHLEEQQWMVVSTLKAQEAGAVGGQHCRRLALLRLTAARGSKLGIWTLTVKNWCAGELKSSGQRGVKGSRCSPGEAELIHCRETEARARFGPAAAGKTSNKRCLLPAGLVGISDILDCKSLTSEGPSPVGVQKSVTAPRTSFFKSHIFFVFSHLYFLYFQKCSIKDFPTDNRPSSWL